MKHALARIGQKDTANQPGSHRIGQLAHRREKRRHENKEARQKTSGKEQEHSYQMKSSHPSGKNRG